MSANNVLKDFRRKRKLLSNLGEQHATERLGGMWEFLDSRDETHQIIAKINKENSSISALIREGQPAKAGSEREIFVVGLHIIEVCHSSKEHMASIAKRFGTVNTRKGATRQSYVDDAMNGYVHHALDFVEEELKRMADEEKTAGNEKRETAIRNRDIRRHKNALMKEFDGKCAYCGSKLGVTDGGDLEYFYPKSKYPEKMYDIDNMLISCRICNMSKADKFPLDEAENPLLFNPRTDDFDSHMELKSDGKLYGLTEKGNISIETLKLNRPELTKRRKDDEMAQQVAISKKGMIKKFENVVELATAFKKFLREKKNYPAESLEDGDDFDPSSGDDIVTVVVRDEGETLAIIAFKISYSIPEAVSMESYLERSIDSGSVLAVKYGVFSEVPDSNEDFNIFEFGENGELGGMVSFVFPTYDMLKFVHGFDFKGRSFCKEILRRVESSVGLKVKFSGGGTYISLMAWGRTVAQLHRVKDSNDELALALAGYSKDFPVPESESIWRDEIAGLSGYRSGIQPEINWLNGKVGHSRLKHKAGVYNFDVMEGITNEVMIDVISLIKLAKENAKPIENEPEPGEPEGDERESETATVIGSKIDVQKEASQKERCLNVEVYATVLSRFFDSAKAKGEFCFGLLGYWGRGKTYLMKRVEEELSKEGKNYETIHFSAWKYRTTPEAWVHLYETFAEHLTKSKNWFTLLPHLIRTGITRYGFLGITISIFIFGFSILSLGEKVTGLLLPLCGIIGVVGILFCVRMYFGLRRIGTSLKRYITLSRHGDKLGLQNLIGRDLKSLIIGWIPLYRINITTIP